MSTISNHIRTERKKIGLSQEELSKRAGVGLRFIRELEQGKKTVRLDKVTEVLDYLGLKIVIQRVNDGGDY